LFAIETPGIVPLSAAPLCRGDRGSLRQQSEEFGLLLFEFFNNLVKRQGSLCASRFQLFDKLLDDRLAAPCSVSQLGSLTLRGSAAAKP
jgi:hypothetical protein